MACCYDEMSGYAKENWVIAAYIRVQSCVVMPAPALIIELNAIILCVFCDCYGIYSSTDISSIVTY